MQQEPVSNNAQPIDMEELIKARMKGERARILFELLMESVEMTYQNKMGEVMKALQEAMIGEIKAIDTVRDLMQQATKTAGGKKTLRRTPKKGEVSDSN